MAKKAIENLAEVQLSNDADYAYLTPYTVHVEITSTSPLLFHKWSNEDVEAKAAAAKNSKIKKTDNVESYVYRNDKGNICIPGEYVRQAIIQSAKYRQDPRSPRKSAMDLFKAGVIALTEYADTGKKTWDYLDKRRVVIQRAGITRTRPALKEGWQAEIDFQILIPEYIDNKLFYDVISQAGRLIGIGDFRPSYGRFAVTKYEVSEY